MDSGCSSPGNADLYGLGIRLGFYIQWLAGCFAARLGVESDIVAIRSALFGFTIATFVAVLVEIAQSTNTTLDIYIAMLLCFGYFYSSLATYLWRISIGFDNARDFTKIRDEVASAEFDILQRSLLLAVSGFKLWFWTTKVPASNDSPECPKYAFLFYHLELKAHAVRLTNILIDCCMIPIFMYELASAIRILMAEMASTTHTANSTVDEPARRQRGRGKVSAFWNQEFRINDVPRDGHNRPCRVRPK